LKSWIILFKGKIYKMEILSDEDVYLDTAFKLMEYRNYTNIERINTDKFNYIKSD
jgi:hypothetical protein